MSNATTLTSLSNVSLFFVKVVRYMTVNTHIPCKPGQAVTVIENGEPVTGFPMYKGAVWFCDDAGRHYVTFVNKSTKVWQAFREATPPTVGKVHIKSAIVKECRPSEEWQGETLPERYVLTHIKMS